MARDVDIIRIEDLRYDYPALQPGSSPVSALRGVDLSVRRGELVALMGPVGAGKSTLCQAIAGLVPHAWGGLFGGRVLVDGVDTRRVEPAEVCRRVGLVFQDAETQLFNATVEDEVAFGPESLAVPQDEIGRRVDWALAVVHLAGQRQRSPRQLSGGQKQRLAIASVLAMRPSILVLDEPTANLDPLGSRQVYEVLDELRRSGDLTVVLVEQDADRVVQFADRVAVLVDGQVVALGTPREVLARPGLAARLGLTPPVAELMTRLRAIRPGLPEVATLDEAEASLSAALPPTGDARVAVPGATPPGQSPSAGEGVSDGDGADGPRCALGQVALATPVQPAASPAVLEARDVWYRYDNGVEALQGVDLEVRDGDRLAIVGQNGSGKTTLAKLFIGLLRPTRGTVLVEGVDTRRRTIGELASRVGYVFQNPDHQIFAATVCEELAFGPRHLGVPEEEVRVRVDRALELFGLAAYRHEPPAALGFGLRRAVGLAAVLTMSPRVLVLDEPFTGLDWRSIEAVLDQLRALGEQGHAIVLITHNMRAVAEFAERMVVLADGQMIAHETTRALFQETDVLARASLARPPIAELAFRLRRHGLDGGSLTVAELEDECRRALWRSAGASGTATRGSGGG